MINNLEKKMDQIILRKFSNAFEVLPNLFPNTDKAINGDWFYNAAASGSLSFITDFSTEEIKDVSFVGNTYKITRLVTKNEQQISNKMTVYKNIKLDWLHCNILIKNGDNKVYVMKVDKMIDNKYIVLTRVKTFDFDNMITMIDKENDKYVSVSANRATKALTYDDMLSILKGA